MRVIRRRGLGTLPKILVGLTLIVGVSFSLAWVWHTTQQSVAAETGPQSGGQSASLVETPLLENIEAEAVPATEPEPPQVSETDLAAQPEFRAAPQGAVPQSAAVSQSYFDDAIFFGDSISTGIPLYHVADNAAVVAMTGINTDNINHKEAIDTGGEHRVTVIEAAKQYAPRSKVYILLGGNGTGFDTATFIAGYKTFLQSVRELFPEAVIYLQSMTPVTADYVNEFDPELNNEKIDAYNLEIMALAKREGAYYLDIASALKDETGALPKEASPLDGMHFTPEYYARWFYYLRTHTVKDE